MQLNASKNSKILKSYFMYFLIIEQPFFVCILSTNCLFSFVITMCTVYVNDWLVESVVIKKQHLAYIQIIILFLPYTQV